MDSDVWTSEQPTSPGLYWYRKDSGHEPDVVKVSEWAWRGLEMNFHDDDRWYVLLPGQWAGPLRPPRGR